jgi:HEAT repeat protein
LLEDLLKKLNNRSSGRRFDAIRLCEELPAEVILAIARVSVSDPAWLVRCEATDYLADYGTSLDRYRIRLLLKDPSWLVRSSAVEAVQQVFGKKGEASLIPMLEDKHPIVRRDAAQCLGELGLKSSIPHLKRRLL